MDRISYLKPDQSEIIFASHVRELLRRTAYKGPQFTFYLDERQVQVALAALTGKTAASRMYGGFPEAERCVLGLADDIRLLTNEKFPITPVSITASKNNTLSHRDVLGALMALNFERKLIGDILTKERQAVVFLSAHIAQTVVRELTCVGNFRVDCEEGLTFELPKPTLDPFHKIAGSLRIDSIVAAMVSVSRSKAQRMIQDKKVFCNARQAEDPTLRIAAGDKISVRGIGKFLFWETGSQTKSGKYHISFFQYR